MAATITVATSYTTSGDTTTQRLAAILMGLAEDNAEVKRRLRLELAAEAGGDTIAAEIGKRLVALRSARSFIDW